MFSALGLSSLPLRVFKTYRKCNKCLGSILSSIRTSGSAYSTGLHPNVFENPQVEKFLDFLSNGNPKELLKSNTFEKVSKLLMDKNDLERELKSLSSMSSEGDDELKKLIELEQKQFLENLKKIKEEILVSITSDNVNENRNIELQVISGIGGEEAKLFKNELMLMYVNYAKFKNWEYEYEPNSDYMLISGEFVYGYMKYEGGVHRVQRVPETEKMNRVHTSTCSVVILPQPKPFEVQIHDKDLIIEKMRSSGPGGQHVNKTESCVRITHKPSGIVVESQTSRFQYKNKELAVNRLRSILFNIDQTKKQNERRTLIKGQAGQNDYADKIRTYNFPQNRVTDHRLNYSVHNLRGFLSGSKDLDSMIMQLKYMQREKDFLGYIETTLQSSEYKAFEKKNAE